MRWKKGEKKAREKGARREGKARGTKERCEARRKGARREKRREARGAKIRLSLKLINGRCDINGKRNFITCTV